MVKWILSVVYVLIPSIALSHPLDLALIRLSLFGNKIEATTDLHPEVEKSLDMVAELRNWITQDETPCQLGQQTRSVKSETAVVWTSSWNCPSRSGERVKLTLPFLKDSKLPGAFEAMVRYPDANGNEILLTLNAEKNSVPLESGPHSAFGSFVWMGMQHIGVTPDQWLEKGHVRLPDGLDHLFFLLALLFAGGGLLGVIGVATGFTVGHSITLAIASVGLFRPPASWIEPLIALSIAFVAMRTALGAKPKSRWKESALFGLVHGFGFAGALAELNLSRYELGKALLGFNLGVEIGQAAFIVIIYPLLHLLLKRAAKKNWPQRVASSGIAGAGIYWFVQRVFV